jgi:hypothetical protein
VSRFAALDLNLGKPQVEKREVEFGLQQGQAHAVGVLPIYSVCGDLHALHLEL